MDQILKRSDKIAFYKVGNTYHRMRGFTNFSISKNPIEYSRKYIDEKSKRNDVVGYDPSIAYSFDRIVDDAVHEDIVAIADNEAVGADAIREILIVDKTAHTDDGYKAQIREFSVIPDSEGSDSDNYTYSGTLKASGIVIHGFAELSNMGATATFEEEEVIEDVPMNGGRPNEDNN